MKQWTEAMKNISMIGQLGLSLIMPVLICVGICYALTTYVGMGGWIYIIGILFGLGGSGATGYKFYQMTMKDQAKDQKKHKRSGVFFNSHQ